MRGSCLALAASAAAILTFASVPAEATGRYARPEVEQSRLVEAVRFGHRSKAISMYCYPRKYWWFYRPYTTSADNHIRCMPYFKYPRRGGGGPDGIK